MSRLDQYKEYREVGQELNTNILNTYSNQDAILNSAEQLGIEQDGNDLLYEFESDMTVHFEFLLYEYRQNDQTFAEQYYNEDRWETQTERTILEAMLEADTSLFQIITINEADNQLVVTDLLNNKSDIPVLDINLSQTAAPGVLLFFRLVSYDEFNMTSGISFPFSEDEQDRLLNEYDSRATHLASQPTSVQRFVAFYDLYRDYGTRIHYD